jgi:hypothetical protein
VAVRAFPCLLHTVHRLSTASYSSLQCLELRGRGVQQTNATLQRQQHSSETGLGKASRRKQRRLMRPPR